MQRQTASRGWENQTIASFTARPKLFSPIQPLSERRRIEKEERIKKKKNTLWKKLTGNKKAKIDWKLEKLYNRVQRCSEINGDLNKSSRVFLHLLCFWRRSCWMIIEFHSEVFWIKQVRLVAIWSSFSTENLRESQKCYRGYSWYYCGKQSVK